jgi:xanthine dehydrogenase YagR molybdenum-binding subunit
MPSTNLAGDGLFKLPLRVFPAYTIFLEETDPMSSPMKAKGIGELGLGGVAAALANCIYNATGVRVRNYPITLDKLLYRMPEVG